MANIDDVTDGILEAASETLAEIQDDWDAQKQLIQAEARQLQTDLDSLLAPLKERIAKLEGQMTVLLGSDSTNSPPKSKRSKQSPDNGQSRLLEHRPQ
jgi:hypothetical protein